MIRTDEFDEVKGELEDKLRKPNPFGENKGQSQLYSNPDRFIVIPYVSGITEFNKDNLFNQPLTVVWRALRGFAQVFSQPHRPLSSEAPIEPTAWVYIDPRSAPVGMIFPFPNNKFVLLPIEADGKVQYDAARYLVNPDPVLTKKSDACPLLPREEHCGAYLNAEETEYLKYLASQKGPKAQQTPSVR